MSKKGESIVQKRGEDHATPGIIVAQIRVVPEGFQFELLRLTGNGQRKRTTPYLILTESHLVGPLIEGEASRKPARRNHVGGVTLPC